MGSRGVNNKTRPGLPMFPMRWRILASSSWLGSFNNTSEAYKEPAEHRAKTSSKSVGLRSMQPVSNVAMQAKLIDLTLRELTIWLGYSPRIFSYSTAHFVV